MPNDVLFFQQALLKQCGNLSPEIVQAFYQVPRHLFIKRYKKNHLGAWETVTEQNLKQHLETLYSDGPLILAENTQVVSTISQPTFVLKILDLLNIKKGHKVFELGTGSGWNAALMGHLVGSEGKVISVEIIPELVKTAQEHIQSLHMSQVKIILGDGGNGYEKEAPYDRAIFTAGAYDLPKAFFEQVKEQGLLVFVLKQNNSPDILMLLKKFENYFEVIESLHCGFVSMTGSYQNKNEDDLPDFASMRVKIYPIETKIEPASYENLFKRQYAQFLFSASTF